MKKTILEPVGGRGYTTHSSAEAYQNKKVDKSKKQKRKTNR